MSKFLYGAAVQGIQSFILQTNKLKDIVGASEMVSQICTRLFYELLTKKESSDEQLENELASDTSFILHAAGNVKYIFEDKEQCARIVREFPKLVVEYAPGITVSQAVVEFGEKDFSSAVNLLEKKLSVQRNKPARSVTVGLMGIARSRQTGLPAVMRDRQNNLLDESTKKKRDCANKKGLYLRAFGFSPKDSNIAYEISDLTHGDNNWIAVIHADGNGLGSIVQKIGGNPERFRRFSQELDKATVSAAQQAFYTACPDIGKDSDAVIPIRPIVLSGDDLTVICRADIALTYTQAFLKAFEEKTRGLITESDSVFTQGDVRDRMTACAGIAYVKASYPYYYAYELAESLCAAAKRDAKDKPSIKEGHELPQSCLLFHKVRDSFTQDYKEIVQREMSPKPGISLQCGPYYVKEKTNRWTIKELMEVSRKLEGEKGTPVKNTIRQWLSLLYRGNGQERQLLERARQLYQKEDSMLVLLNKAVQPIRESGPVPAYDILVINSINK